MAYAESPIVISNQQFTLKIACEVPTDAPTWFKAWMPHTALTDNKSDQYQLQEEDYAENTDTQETVCYINYKVPEKDTTFKAFMDYQKITDKTSKQYELQQQAYTDEQGLRKIDDMYCVALGTYYAAECGGKFKVTLDTGLEFKVIVSDIKRDKDTDKENVYTPMENGNANLLEFVVDEKLLSKEVREVYGDISKLGFEGNVQKIEKILTNKERSSIEEN